MPNAAQKRRMKLRQQQLQQEGLQQEGLQQQPQLLLEPVTEAQGSAMEEEEENTETRKQSQGCSNDKAATTGASDDDEDDDSFDEDAVSSSACDVSSAEDDDDDASSDEDEDEGMPDAAPAAPKAAGKATAKATAKAKAKAKAAEGPCQGSSKNKNNNNSNKSSQNSQQVGGHQQKQHENTANDKGSDLCDRSGCLDSVEEALKGWPRPRQNPPGWPPIGSELLACHSQAELSTALLDSDKSGEVEADELGRCDHRRRLLLAGLTCPQPNDALQWRIFPLVRQALALEASLDAAALAKHVEAGLPRVCLAHTSTSHLRGLVNLVLSRSVRCGRLKEKNKRYSLPASENPSIPVPEGVLGLVLKELWTAWCIETKKPREVGLLFAASSSSSSSSSAAAAAAGAASPSSTSAAAPLAAPLAASPSAPAAAAVAGTAAASSLWLFARPLAKGEDQAARSAAFADPVALAELLTDRITVNGIEVTAQAHRTSDAAAPSGILRADWYEPKAKVAWALLPGLGCSLPADLIPEVVMACTNST